MAHRTESFVVTATRREVIRLLDHSVTADTVTNLNMMAWIPRLGTITPLEWDVSWGITGSIAANQRIELYLTLVDVNNLPTIVGASDRAIWGVMQFYRFSTNIGVQKRLMREIQDFFRPTSFTFREVVDFTQRSGIALIAHLGSTINIDVVGVLTYEMTMIQRVFGSDSATFNNSDSGWIDDFADEEEGDND